MKVKEIRKAFLEFFAKKGHVIVPSSSLVPSNDPTLLFTNAGMVPFKDVFLGKEKREYKRAASVQKCVRAGGKHNDLENVGYTARHHTFFEMLGNFSFGDYFKKEAIAYAWEFTTEVLQLPQDKLYVSVYKDDDESAAIWEKDQGIEPKRIYRFGEKDNFWQMGDTGPCGPCTELFIDRGEQYCQKRGQNDPQCQVGCECDRFIEFWNLVFMQYNRDETGALTPLPKPSVDTGAGLERLAAILQGVETNYDTDIFRELIHFIGTLSGHSYEPNSSQAFPFRVIADHARAVSFLMSDGVMPSNEGRGYVLRRIMRRAIRHGKQHLGFESPFLFKVCVFVCDQMGDVYPELIENKDLVKRAVFAEEEQFYHTLDRGLQLLGAASKDLKPGEKLSGEVAFKLYDTFGFPLDLTKSILREKNLSVDEAGFERAMSEQKNRSRQHWVGTGDQQINETFHEVYERLKEQNCLPQFVGYSTLKTEAEALAVLPSEEGFIEVVFDKTPFYGESGGQVGDKGRVVSDDGFEAEVVDTQKPLGDLIVHKLKVIKGTCFVGKHYKLEVAQELRQWAAKNHTATHLLHWALREVLGSHVKQAGSLVTPEFLRFDFTHFEALTDEQLHQIEELINQKIWQDAQVVVQEKSKDEALAAGAVGIFGEKYGDVVRVVDIGGYSVELCGGTHVSRLSEIHLFKITQQASIAAGVRRIVAVTSQAAYRLFVACFDQMRAVKQLVKVHDHGSLMVRLNRLIEVEKQARQLQALVQQQEAKNLMHNLVNGAESIGDVQWVAGLLTEKQLESAKGLRELALLLIKNHPTLCLLLGYSDAESQNIALVIAVGRKAQEKVSAAELIKEITQKFKVRGGGKREIAQTGGLPKDKFDETSKIIKEKIKNSLTK